jgi:hypothetical protein
MRVGPSRPAFRSRSQTASKLLRLRAVVVSVEGKARGKLAQVRIRETNESKPFDDASLELRCRRNQVRQSYLGPIRWVPDDWADDDRRREGVKRMQAIARNCRNQSLRC